MRRLSGSLWGLFAGAALALAPALSVAAPNAECAGGACGTPNQSGGGCGCGGGSILINNTDLGDTYQYADDFDDDGWEDDFDNCPFSANADQSDDDGDGFGNDCDNCRGASNPMQTNADGDALGDSCDDDADDDTIPNAADNCMLFPNLTQLNGDDDPDHDNKGNMCDTDDDEDGVLDPADNCPLIANAQQDPSDPTTFGPACKSDEDLDGIPDSFDNCPNMSGLDVADHDGDGVGDLCDNDLDNDGVFNLIDNCRQMQNPTQVDGDHDGLGDRCDAKFCFTVDSPEAGRCLDPEAPFFARPGPDITIKTGETVRLRLFANRQETAIRYTWNVTDAPDERAWAIHNPRGSVTHSSPWEYHYQRDRLATFTATEPGDYIVQVDSELVFPDQDAFPTKSSDVQSMKITVEGDPVFFGMPASVGCNQSGASVPALAGLATLMLLRRRRR